MKIKFVLSLAVPVLVMLGTAGCVTSTNSYTRDIVYRDGSYYSPADEQYGDYYYEPEPDYSYYDDNYYGFNNGFNSGYYGNSWYGHGYSSRCRFSYRHDRYCDNDRGNSFLNFGGLTIIFGSSNYYAYGYPHHGYYGGYLYYGWHSPRPRPHNNNSISMPKPNGPIIPSPNYGLNYGSGMRVPSEPIRITTKPGLVDENPVTPVIEQDQENWNPYTRTRQPRPNIRPEVWRNNRDDRAEDGIVIRNARPARPILVENSALRLRTEPSLLAEDNAYQSAEKPIRQNQNRNPQRYPRADDGVNDARQTPATEPSGSAASERASRNSRRERPARAAQQESNGDQ